MQVDRVGSGGEPVAVLDGVDGVPAERPAQSAHERLDRARRVGGRLTVPDLVHEHRHRDLPAGAQGEDREQGTQPRPAEGDGRAVVAKYLGRTEDAVAHGAIVREGDRDSHSHPIYSDSSRGVG